MRALLIPTLLLTLSGGLAAQAPGERELTVGGAFHQTGASWEGPVKLGHENLGALVADYVQPLGRFPARGVLRLETGANGYVRMESLAVGLQKVAVGREGLFQVKGYVGVDVRVEHLRGRKLDEGQQGYHVWVQQPWGSGFIWQPYPVNLRHAEAWMLRPWVRMGCSLRGLWLPDPVFFLTGYPLIARLTQGGPTTHPITRLEVAMPLWRQGGEGRTGQLRQMAPGFELDYQLGMQF